MRFAKARRYIGLLIAIGFVAIMFWQVERYPSGLSNFVMRTSLTAIISSTDRGNYVRATRAYEARCSYAQQAADRAVGAFPKASANQQVRNECDPEPMLNWPVATLVRLGQFEPNFFELSQEYRALRSKIQEEQGLKYNQAPPMTPELSELAGKLLKPVIEEAAAAEQWVARMILSMHALVLVLGICGVVFRQALGSIAIAPLGWIFGLGVSGAKAAHEIHKKI